jgi:Coenzyme PQQ synthesis protein D (PqqD)
MADQEPFAASQVPVRSLDARVRNFRGKLLVASGERSVELDEVGAYIFRNIDGVSSMRQIADKVASEYCVSQDLALADGCEFVTMLAALGIVGASGDPIPRHSS